MLYNAEIEYNQPFTQYYGTLIVNAQSLSSPIVLNNITLLVLIDEDYTNQTTIGIITLDYASSGIIEIEVLDTDVQAFFSVENQTISGVMV